MQRALDLGDGIDRKQVDRGLLEADVQRAVMQLLAAHPRVAFAHRINTRVVDVVDKRKPGNTRPMVTAPKGHPDIAGMLTDGRALYIECKRASGGKLTPDQAAFLANVHRYGGVAIVATSVDDVLAAIPLEVKQ